MPTTIFDLGLSVEAVSLFLLIEGLEGNRIDPDKNCTARPQPITVESCLAKWSGGEADFKAALTELTAIGALKNEHSQLSITKADTWKTKQV
ncbi:hypothetical protein [Maridesulfovibrio sp.]|uniref:hypothetical protein n=1 Tax=Maridesulfovibrio sp. TaxID=2795000 RepID=UPI002A1891BE|nr:hypothetical protein [Maridesulfovibrio sp.]